MLSREILYTSICVYVCVCIPIYGYTRGGPAELPPDGERKGNV